MTLALPKPTKPVKVRKRLRRGAPPKRTARPRQRRKGAIAELKRLAWALASKLCRALAKWSCERCTAPDVSICESGVVLSAAHCVSRRYEATEYRLENLVALCAYCHEYLKDAPPGRESKMKEFFIGLRGAELFVELEREALAWGKFKPEQYEYLRQEAARMGIAA